MTSPKNRQAERSEQTRAQILAACRVVFSQKGVLGASLKDIESAAKVPRALIYYHFGSIDNIVATITKQNLGRARELITQKLKADLAENRSESGLHNLALELLKLVDEITLGPGKAMSIHVWSTALVNPEIREIMEDMFAGIRKELDKSLELCSKELSQDAKHRKEVAVSFFSLIIPAYIVQRLFSGKQSLEPDKFLAAHETLFRAMHR